MTYYIYQRNSAGVEFYINAFTDLEEAQHYIYLLYKQDWNSFHKNIYYYFLKER